jgi:acetylcholinesterase
MQSATSNSDWAVISKEEATSRALRLAEGVGCPHDSKKLTETVECLRQKDAKELVKEEWKNFTGVCQFPFVPIVDGVFLKESPKESIAKGNFKKTEILTGTDKEEATYFLLYSFPQIFKNHDDIKISRETFLKTINESFPQLSGIQRGALAYEYTNWNDLEDSASNIDALDKMLGDYLFTCNVNEWAQRYAENGNKVFMYYYTHRTKTNPWPKWAGVLHGDEINFVFGEPLNPKFNYPEEEKHFSRRVMRYWANFARNG